MAPIVTIMKNRKRVSLQQVARAADVSTMTASRALRGPSQVKEETRARVLECAEKLGYRVDARMHELMAHIRSGQTAAYTGSLCFLRGSKTKGHEPQLHSSTATHLEAAKAHAASRGYKLEVMFLPFDGSEDKQIHRILTARGIRGLIICPPEGENLTLPFDLTNYASVVLGNAIKVPALHRVVDNHTGAIEICMEELRRRGYVRPGLAIHVRADTNTHHQWLGGFLLEQSFLPKKNVLPVVKYDDLSNRPEQKIVDWYKRNQPDVVICSGPEGKVCLEKAGVRFPQDAGFVCLSAEGILGKVAGPTHNPYQSGELAVDKVITQLLSNTSGVPPLAHESRVSALWVDAPTVRSLA